MLQAIRIMISMKKHIVTTRLPEVGLAYDWQLYRTPRLSSQTNTYPHRLSHTLTDYHIPSQTILSAHFILTHAQ
jgi:hypothetical protein